MIGVPARCEYSTAASKSPEWSAGRARVRGVVQERAGRSRSGIQIRRPAAERIERHQAELGSGKRDPRGIVGVVRIREQDRVPAFMRARVPARRSPPFVPGTIATSRSGSSIALRRRPRDTAPRSTPAAAPAHGRGRSRGSPAASPTRGAPRRHAKAGQSPGCHGRGRSRAAHPAPPQRRPAPAARQSTAAVTDPACPDGDALRGSYAASNQLG